MGGFLLRIKEIKKLQLIIALKTEVRSRKLNAANCKPGGKKPETILSLWSYDRLAIKTKYLITCKFIIYDVRSYSEQNLNCFR